MHGKPRNRAAGVEGSTGESPPSGRYASASKQETAPAHSVPKAETPHRAGATRLRRGRPPKITRDQIVEAVLSHGFAGITIPEVAQRLGVTTMTVYRHAATRAELLGMAWERVLDEHAWPDRNLPWRDLLDEYATAVAYSSRRSRHGRFRSGHACSSSTRSQAIPRSSARVAACR